MEIHTFYKVNLPDQFLNESSFSRWMLELGITIVKQNLFEHHLAHKIQKACNEFQMTVEEEILKECLTAEIEIPSELTQKSRKDFEEKDNEIFSEFLEGLRNIGPQERIKNALLTQAAVKDMKKCFENSEKGVQDHLNDFSQKFDAFKISLPSINQPDEHTRKFLQIASTANSDILQLNKLINMFLSEDVRIYDIRTEYTDLFRAVQASLEPALVSNFLDLIAEVRPMSDEVKEKIKELLINYRPSDILEAEKIRFEHKVDKELRGQDQDDILNKFLDMFLGILLNEDAQIYDNSIGYTALFTHLQLEPTLISDSLDKIAEVRPMSDEVKEKIKKLLEGPCDINKAEAIRLEHKAHEELRRQVQTAITNSIEQLELKAEQLKEQPEKNNKYKILTEALGSEMSAFVKTGEATNLYQLKNSLSKGTVEQLGVIEDKFKSIIENTIEKKLDTSDSLQSTVKRLKNSCLDALKKCFGLHKQAIENRDSASAGLYSTGACVKDVKKQVCGFFKEANKLDRTIWTGVSSGQSMPEYRP